jgi:hypothetical protein
MNTHKYYFLFVFVLLLFSCSENNNDNLSSSDNYNRQALLDNLVSNIIIPAHDNHMQHLNDLQSHINTFISEKTISNLQSVRSSFIDSYMAWQHIEMFDIGYAEEIMYRRKMNIYPTNTDRVEINIQNQNIDFDSNPNQYAAQGYPAIDYMIYGLADSDEEILNKYTNDESNQTYVFYFEALINDMVSSSESVIEYWSVNGSDFISSSGNSASSSLNMLVNDFVYYYEKGFRANKIGIPAGYWSGLLPQNVEAFYKQDISKDLAKEALSACKNFFLGNHFGDVEVTGEGLYDYLAYLDDTNYSDSEMFIGLEDDIIDALDNSMQKLELLSDNFVTQINTDNLKMLQAFDAIQVGVVRLKTNMMSILGISVDYFDADGD